MDRLSARYFSLTAIAALFFTTLISLIIFPAASFAVTGVDDAIVDVGVGTYHIIVLTEDGSVYAWGNNSYGELGIGNTTSQYDAVEIDTSSFIGEVVDVCAGGYSSMVRTDAGHVYIWGYNNNGQLGRGNTTSPQTMPIEVNTSAFTGTPIALAMGNANTFILTDTGNIYGCGFNSQGEVGIGTTSLTVTSFQALAVASLDGTVTQIFANGNSGFALTDSGALYAWGFNTQGQLGLGDTTSRSAPTLVSASNFDGQVINVAVGNNFTLFVTDAGAVYAAGLNSLGQLGNGNTTNQSTPVLINLSGISGNVVSVFAGYASAYLTTDTGAVYVWGENTHAELGIAYNYTNQLLPVALNTSTYTGDAILLGGGQYFSYAVTDGGALLSWGYSNYGQVGQGSGIMWTVAPIHTAGPLSYTFSPGLLKVQKVLTGEAYHWGVGDSTTFTVRVVTSDGRQLIFDPEVTQGQYRCIGFIPFAGNSAFTGTPLAPVYVVDGYGSGDTVLETIEISVGQSAAIANIPLALAPYFTVEEIAPQSTYQTSFFGGSGANKITLTSNKTANGFGASFSTTLLGSISIEIANNYLDIDAGSLTIRKELSGDIASYGVSNETSFTARMSVASGDNEGYFLVLKKGTDALITSENRAYYSAKGEYDADTDSVYLYQFDPTQTLDVGGDDAAVSKVYAGSLAQVTSKNPSYTIDIGFSAKIPAEVDNLIEGSYHTQELLAPALSASPGDITTSITYFDCDIAANPAAGPIGTEPSYSIEYTNNCFSTAVVKNTYPAGFKLGLSLKGEPYHWNVNKSSSFKLQLSTLKGQVLQFAPALKPNTYQFTGLIEPKASPASAKTASTIKTAALAPSDSIPFNASTPLTIIGIPASLGQSFIATVAPSKNVYDLTMVQGTGSAAKKLPTTKSSKGWSAQVTFSGTGLGSLGITNTYLDRDAGDFLFRKVLQGKPQLYGVTKTTAHKGQMIAASGPSKGRVIILEPQKDIKVGGEVRKYYYSVGEYDAAKDVAYIYTFDGTKLQTIGGDDAAVTRVASGSLRQVVQSHPTWTTNVLFSVAKPAQVDNLLAGDYHTRELASQSLVKAKKLSINATYYESDSALTTTGRLLGSEPSTAVKYTNNSFYTVIYINGYSATAASIPKKQARSIMPKTGDGVQLGLLVIAVVGSGATAMGVVSSSLKRRKH